MPPPPPTCQAGGPTADFATLTGHPPTPVRRYASARRPQLAATPVVVVGGESLEAVEAVRQLADRSCEV